MQVPQKRCPTCGLEVDSSQTVCPKDGTSLASGLDEDSLFAQKYQILEYIGSGGMGLIYKARHLILDKDVAIKILRSNFVSEESVRRFQIEGKAASLLSHPYIITIYDFGVTNSGQPYLVMDYVNGKTLAAVLKKEGLLTSKRVLNIFSKACEALAHAHERQVLHRDVKPSNIMLLQTKNGEEIRIMDFGIAKVLTDAEGKGQQLTKAGEAIGSPIYMSPEQARGTKTDARTDLYSVGCVMYESLTGAPPFQGNTALDTMMMHLTDEPLPMREASLGEPIDQGLEAIVMKLLKKNPEQRYQSMTSLLEDLKSVEMAKAAKTTASAQANNNWIFKTKPAKITIVALAVILGAAAMAVQPFLQSKVARINPSETPPPAASDNSAREISETNSENGSTTNTGKSNTNGQINDPSLDYVLSHNATSAEANFQRGAAFLRLNHYKEADEKFAATINQTDKPELKAQCFTCRYQCNMQLHHFIKAAEFAAAAAKTLQDAHLAEEMTAGLFFDEAVALEAMAQFDDAVDVREKAKNVYARVQPTYPEIKAKWRQRQVQNLFYLSADRAVSSDLDHAKLDLAEGQRLQKRFAVDELKSELNALVCIGDVQRSKGQYQESLKNYKEALALVPETKSDEMVKLEKQIKASITDATKRMQH